MCTVTKRGPIIGLLSFLLLICCSLSSIAQVYNSHQKSEFSPKQIEKLKKTTTLFVLRDQDLESIDIFADAFKDWNFTPLRFINDKDLPDYLLEDGYSYFNIGIDNRQVTSGASKPHDVTHIFLSLAMPLTLNNEDGSTTESSISFSRSELFPDYQTMLDAANAARFDNFNHRLYKKSTLKNWLPGMLKVYLMEVQDDLNNSMRPKLFVDFKNEEALERLKKDTLFVPDYVLQWFNIQLGSENGKQSKKELFGDYKHPYKILTPTAFNAKLLHATKETFFLDYVRSAADKFISVRSTSEGLIYRKYKPYSYNIKDKDIVGIF